MQNTRFICILLAYLAVVVKMSSFDRRKTFQFISLSLTRFILNLSSDFRVVRKHLFRLTRFIVYSEGYDVCGEFAMLIPKGKGDHGENAPLDRISRAWQGLAGLGRS